MSKRQIGTTGIAAGGGDITTGTMTMAGVIAGGGGITDMIAMTGAGATGTIGAGTMIVTIGVDQRT